MKISKEKALKASNGITLIALVITIIVLLILAGISISMLSGDNGILQKSTEAKQNSEKAQIEERIKLAYHSALTEGQGSYTKEILEEELQKEFGVDYEVDDSNDTNWIIKAKGQTVTISAGIRVDTTKFASEIFEKNGTTKGKMHIGDYVNYEVYYDNVYTNPTNNAYKADNQIYGNKWRIIRVEENEVILVSAGVPLRFYVPGAEHNETIESKLKNDFFGIQFGTEGITFRNNSGFKTSENENIYLNNITNIKQMFANNAYTKIKNNLPDVRAMTKDDIDEIISETSNGTLDVNDLYAVPCDSNNSGKFCYTWFATSVQTQYGYSIYKSKGTGSFGFDGASATYGIRVVVKLKDNLKYQLESNINNFNVWNLNIV